MLKGAALVCMALNVHYEAGVDPVEGQLAVALVTRNRAQHIEARVCNEVFRPGQFVWVDDIKPGPSKTQMARLKSLAVVSWSATDFTGGATHFCHYKHYCFWSVGMQFQGRWGSHNFYKKGSK